MNSKKHQPPQVFSLVFIPEKFRLTIVLLNGIYLAISGPVMALLFWSGKNQA